MSSARQFDWEAEGRRLGGTLNAFHSIAVLGENRTATALVALGIARSQAAHRRVALGDLLGEVEVLQDLVTGDDPHGLVDSFVYGVSLSRVARPVPEDGELFILPTGSTPLDYDELLTNPRWQRLAAGFQKIGALMVIAAPASAENVEDFVAALDGAILVGDVAPAHLAVTQVIGSVREPRVVPPPPPVVDPEVVERRKSPRGVRTRSSVAGIGIAVAIAAAGVWLAMRPLSDGHRPFQFLRGDSATAAGDLALSADSTTEPGTTLVPTGPPPVPENPTDAQNAAAFAVSWLSLNTEPGAILKLREDGVDLPAPTFVPVVINGGRWFELRLGAYTSRADADSLLANLQAKRLLPPGSGRVIRAPYAFLLDSAVADSAPALLARYVEDNRPAYALVEPDGIARIYVGAFETPAQSMLFAESLRAAGLSPRLVYRTGRVF